MIGVNNYFEITQVTSGKGNIYIDGKSGKSNKVSREIENIFVVRIIIYNTSVILPNFTKTFSLFFSFLYISYILYINIIVIGFVCY